MTHRAPQRLGKGVSGLVLASAFVWGACRDLVAGDASNVMDKLCETLDACYGGDATVPDCDDVLRVRFDGGTQEEVDGFLRLVQSRDCFDTCPHALGCVDEAPLCSSDDGCVGRSDCCGWSSGASDCLEGACCKRHGQACQSNDECCDEDCRAGYCGGQACSAVGDACTSSFECCTDRCVAGACQSLYECAGLDEPCKGDADCCADTAVEGPVPTALLCDLDSHRCRPPTEGCTPGSACDPTPGKSCCEDKCWPTDAGGICGQTNCAPVDVDCESDGDCCAPAVCVYDPVPHCEKINDGECTLTGGSCDAAEDCCSNACSAGPTTAGGVCLESSGSPCGTTAGCHDPCMEGDALDATVCASDPTFSDRVACIAAVVQLDPFCGCVEWDALCQEEATLPCQCP